VTTPTPLLEVHDLEVSLRRGRFTVPLVHDVSFTVAEGETVGVVGESGSGKSLTMLAVAGLLPRSLAITKGSVRLSGQELVDASADTMQRIRGDDIGIVYQDPMTSLNPVMRIGEQVAETLVVHGTNKREAWERAVEMLDLVGIPRADRAARAFPHEFSGGMRQRVMIACSLVLNPALLIADEPTTALDVTIQQQILSLVRRLQRENRMAVLWVTHDLGVLARLVEKVLVMYAGHVVETSDVQALFQAPEHPYSAGLLASLPSLDDDRRPLHQIPGRPPEATTDVVGCPFRPRCPQARDVCQELPPMLERGPQHSAACWVPRAEWTA
jgi:oligopeptide/dipeptide ABC transporter ATP-binding protein